jgi:glycosyltransferase involved in cell wall biosynthesis
MKDAPQASIIIPVYNVERYLEECLDSAVGQTLQDIEIICVNDGSTDGSRAILERYAHTDPRIIIVDKQNGGLSSARNAGLDVANGEYVIFLDSDDFQESELLELCCEKAEESSLDIVFFDAQSFFESDDLRKNFAVYDGLYIRKGEYDDTYDGLSLFDKLRAHGDYREHACLSLYRKSFLKEKSLRFVGGIIHEDDVFTFSALLEASRIQHIPRALYHRRVRDDSIITSQKSGKSFWGKSIGQVALTAFLAKNYIDPAANPAIADYLEERRWSIHGLFSEIWEPLTATEAAKFFDQMLDVLGPIDAIAILARRFWDDRRPAATKLGDSMTIRCTRETVKTIGMFYHRLYNGGTEKVVAYLIDLFFEMGYQVVLFTNQEPNHDDYITAHACERVVLPVPERDIEYRLRAEVFFEALKAHNVDLFIYHAWIYELALWDALLIKSLGASFLMYTHNPWASKSLHIESSYRFEMPSVYALFDGVVSLTRCDRLYWGCFNSNARFIYNPALIKPPALDEYIPASDELLWVGRLAREKNYEDLIRVMELVVRERPQAHLTIVGKGESEEIEQRFQEMINACGLHEAITLAGYHRDVSPYYRKAAVFLLTSRYEGFCYTLLESKSYALPCIAYDMPYLEMFREDKGILAVPHGDAAQMAREVVDLLGNQDALRMLSEDARASFLPYHERDMAAIWQEAIAGSVHKTMSSSRATDDYHFVDPDEDETLHLLCTTELFFTEMALRNARNEYQGAITREREIYAQLQRVLNSKSFRVGNILMMVPRKIRALLTRGQPS